MKTLIFIVAGIMLAGGATTACIYWVKLPSLFKEKTQASVVRVEPISRGELIEVVSAPGDVLPRTKVSISAKVAAPIIALPFKEGDRVTKDAIIARLDAKELEAALTSAQARLAGQIAQIEVSQQRILASNATIDSMQANLGDAQKDLDRQKKLLITQDVSPSVVDTAQTKVASMAAQLRSSQFSRLADEANLKVEKAQRDAAQADVNKAMDDLSYTVIRSPIDGVITRRKSEVGEMVVPGIQGSPGSTIVELADLSQMLMVARVDESSITQVVPGQHVVVRMQAYPDMLFDGTVEWVANSRADTSSGIGNAAAGAGDSSRYFECKIRLFTRGEHVKSGLSADADIEVHHHTGLKVESQAVVGRPTESLPAEFRAKQTKSISTVVFRVINGKAVITPVTVGPSDETHTLITSGLNDGDKVIVGPFKELENLSEGQSVTVEATVAKAVKPSGK